MQTGRLNSMALKALERQLADSHAADSYSLPAWRHMLFTTQCHWRHRIVPPQSRTWPLGPSISPMSCHSATHDLTWAVDDNQCNAMWRHALCKLLAAYIATRHWIATMIHVHCRPICLQQQCSPWAALVSVPPMWCHMGG